MTSYSLIEYKIRRYLYLGHEYSMYIASSMRSLNCEQNHQIEIFGIRIIGKIVKKNKAEEINSIVPIILKIKKENRLYDDRLLIFMLAVCAGFNLKQCVKMVADAYAAISIVCTDGLKLLMFSKFYKTATCFLYKEGYIYNERFGFPNGFRKALRKWYLNRDPLLTTQQIVRHKQYEGWSHKYLMKVIHIHSDDPSRAIFIVYVTCGMDKVEKLYGTKLKSIEIEDDNETFENKQLKFIYIHLKRIHNLKKMDEISLLNDIELNKWGQQFEVIPKKMLCNSKILTSLIMHMPLRTLLDNTFLFAKRRLFCNSTPNVGLWEYILRFNNVVQLQKSRIHPIESFIEYVKYSRTYLDILNFQTIDKNNVDLKIELPDNKLKVILKTKNFKKNDLNSVTTDATLKESSEKEESTIQLPLNSTNNEVQGDILDLESKLEKLSNNNDNQSQSIEYMILLKPPPKLRDHLLMFLSEDLIKKTLENLKPSGHRIVITYDSRIYTKTTKCACSHLVNTHEAITLIILSLIYPEKLQNKPTVYCLDEPEKQSNKDIKIDYSSQPLTFSNLESILFKASTRSDSNLDKKNISDVDPLFVMDWAIENKKEYDVFVFLGTNKMNLKNIKKAKKEYQEFSKKSLKIIVCCLNGMHVEQSNLNRQNMLFIAGFDKNVGKLIDSFIKNEF